MDDAGDLVHVTRLDQAEQMRLIRNACRTFMTRNTAEISAAEQEKWFRDEVDSGKSETVLPFLYWPKRTAHSIGYGLIRKIEDRWWVSGGLWPTWRGMGHGKQLFAELADYVNDMGHQCWLEVRDDNRIAIAVYQSLGFVPQFVSVDGQTAVHTMSRHHVRRNERP